LASSQNLTQLVKRIKRVFRELRYEGRPRKRRFFGMWIRLLNCGVEEG